MAEGILTVLKRTTQRLPLSCLRKHTGVDTQRRYSRSSNVGLGTSLEVIVISQDDDDGELIKKVAPRGGRGERSEPS